MDKEGIPVAMDQYEWEIRHARREAELSQDREHVRLLKEEVKALHDLEQARWRLAHPLGTVEEKGATA